jgi:hypothetical protein
MSASSATDVIQHFRKHVESIGRAYLGQAIVLIDFCSRLVEELADTADKHHEL